MRSDKYKKGSKSTAREKSTVDTTSSNDVITNAESGSVAKKRRRFSMKKFLLLILALIMTVIIGFGIFATVVIVQAPKINTDDIYSILTESTVIYDANGKVIDTIYTDANRRNVEYKKLPKNLINAFIALEDKTFWDHHGFNFIRILGAIKESIFSGGQVQGTSTITQQLARNLFLKEDMYKHDIRRKIVEAYYTVILEKNLTKEQIIEAYLNTIYFGYGSSGVQAASQAYFSKNVEDLNLAQCAALAAIPQAPTENQLVCFVSNDSVSQKNKNIIKRTSNGTYIMNDESKARRDTCLKLMLEQGHINKEQYNRATKATLRGILKPTYTANSGRASYFTDYVIEEVIQDLMKKNEWDYDTAWDKVYNGGIKIYSTLNPQAQNVIEKEFENDANFPSAINIRMDGSGNILNDSGQITMYDYNDYFDSNENFKLYPSEIRRVKDGSLIIRRNKRLNIYDTEVSGETDYSIEFPTMYVMEGGKLYSISGGFINIPQNYKSANKYNNIVISPKFFKDSNYKGWFKFNDDGSVTVSSKAFTLNQRVIQPQAAMTIVENSTGHIKAMVGGRKTSGRKLYNRAINPRQPGSSIKPLAVYSAALQQSATEAANGKKHSFVDYKIDKQGADLWGNYITPSSIVIDEKTTVNGRLWPQNAGGGYSGPQTLRSALQLSINTCAVKIWLQVGVDYSASLVKKYGITSLVTSGSVSDMNSAALALGGMTKGVTTLEMASAYTVFPNNGTRRDTTSYTKVVDSKGKKILSTQASSPHRVLDSGVAWIMADLLKSVVSAGLGSPAAVYGVQAGGKTGTTSEQYDIWFDGFTPSYSAALWIGNDVNIELSSMSNTAASLWGRIMNQIPAAKTGSYKAAPSTVTYANGDYCIRGTQGGSVSRKKLEKEVTICTDSGLLATPNCTHTKTETFLTYGSDAKEIPEYYCNLHNPDAKKYPISPDSKLLDPSGTIDNPNDNKPPGGDGNNNNNNDNGNGGGNNNPAVNNPNKPNTETDDDAGNTGGNGKK